MGGGDGDELRLRLHQRGGVDPAEQPGQHRRLSRGERAVQDVVGDEGQGAQQPGGAQLRPGHVRGAVLEVGEPSGEGAGPSVGVGDGAAAALVELSGGGGEPAVEAGELPGDGADRGLQLVDVRLVQGLGDQGVDQRCQGRSGRRHTGNPSVPSARTRA
jgi:hypothetical protein